ncbi:hypothetical protein FC90_GL000177 [Latilactobacillus graminis DSM 20719]|uniref:WxL domain-containing protein n=2 Tax=Latilactobacillus graminis TaxID=60519 RepID=A0AA89I2T6_9LACO|nr:hypothetical protein FC90_GL000177 [Latilactobacillus graminis DSM 20719]
MLGLSPAMQSMQASQAATVPVTTQTNNKVKLSVDTTKITAGSNFLLHVNVDQSNEMHELTIDLSNAPTIQLGKAIVADHPEIHVVATKNPAGKPTLKISSQQPLTKQFDVVLKSIDEGTNQLKVIDENNNALSNEVKLRAAYDKTFKVSAIDPNKDIDDGESNWVKVVDPGISSITLSSTVKLQFTFGDTHGKVAKRPGGATPNVFLLKHGIDVANGFNLDSLKGVPSTSPNFELTFKNPTAGGEFVPNNAFSITNYTEDPIGDNLQLYTTVDKNGRKVIKAQGTFHDKTSLEVEVLYRFQAKAPVIQQEAYVKNTDSAGYIYYMAFFGINTMLGDQDYVPMYAMGNNTGLYVMNTKENQKLKMYFNMKVPDGPDAYAAQSGSSAVLDRFRPNGMGVGDESENYPEGTRIVESANNSAYSAHWKWHELKYHQVDHYRSDIGVSTSPLTVPNALKEYSNTTSTDGKNRVGDKLTFKLSAHNIGYESEWINIKIDDQIPIGLDIDTASFKLTDAAGQTTAVPASNYDATTRTLKVASPNLTDNQWSSVTFDATINSQAAGKTLRNTVNVTGDDGKDSTNQYTDADAYVDIPVEISPYMAELTKQVKNETAKDTDYQTATVGHVGDKVAYRLTYNVDAQSTAAMVSGTLSDELPKSGLDIDNQSIKVTYPDGTTDTPNDLSSIALKPTTVGQAQKTVVDFEATINQSAEAGTTIRNIGRAEATTGSDGTFNSSSEADINIPETPYQSTLTKQVKNETTNKPTTFADAVDGHIGDIIDYRMTYTVDRDSPQGLKAGEIQDTLPKEVDLVKGSVKVSGDNQDDRTFDDLSKVTINPLKIGEQAQIDFQVKINDQAKSLVDTKTPIKNVGHLVDGQTDADTKTTSDSNEADINIKKVENGLITFKYIDRKTNEAIGDKEVTVNGPIGKKVSELTTSNISGKLDPNKIRPEFIDGWVAVDYGDDTSPNNFYQIKDIDPVIDSKPQVITIRYERSGLTLSAPQDFDFGEYLAHESDATYYLKALKGDEKHEKIPYSIGISDYYGVKDWSLGVEQAQQFKGNVVVDRDVLQEVKLDNAELRFANASLSQLTSDNENTATDQIDALKQFTLVPGVKNKTTLVTYHKQGQYAAGTGDNSKNQQYDNPGYATYSYQFGDQKSADYSIGLHVPETTKRHKIRYTTTLEWSLTVAP